jgi:vacuolar-type H+-ATPase subunit E/Vma4
MSAILRNAALNEAASIVLEVHERVVDAALSRTDESVATAYESVSKLLAFLHEIRAMVVE